MLRDQPNRRCPLSPPTRPTHQIVPDHEQPAIPKRTVHSLHRIHAPDHAVSSDTHNSRALARASSSLTGGDIGNSGRPGRTTTTCQRPASDEHG